MSNTIKLKRGSGSNPGASDLSVGELAIRTDTGTIFTKKDDNSVAELSGGGISDGDKGDITVSNGGATFTIDSGVVTSAKIADGAIVNADINASAGISFSKMSVLSANTIVGRRVSNGVPQELTAGQVRTILNVEDGATADQSKSDIDALGIAASTAATLATARTIGGVSFNGSANINLPGVNTSGNQNTSGNAATATTSTRVTVTDNSSDTSCFVLFTQAATGNQLPHSGSNLTFNASSGLLTATSFSGNGANLTNLPSQTDNNFTNADHSKLDGIEAGATADQSASEILTLIKTVDGSGSGLDADTLDGVNGANYVRTNQNTTITSDLFIGGGAGGVTVNAGSDIRFANGDWTGNVNGTAKIQHHSNYLYISGGTSGIIFRENNANRWFIDGSGHFTPGADSSYDVGTNSTRVRNGYFDTLYGSGANLTNLPSQTDNNFTNADHSKLDGIESGATADQSASEILTLIKTVDGSGSGLDADTLDGLNAAESGNSARIVRTNSSGYIFANFFNTSPNDVSSGVTKICVETGNDGYIRHGTAAAVRSFLNVADGANNITNNNQLTNGAGYITSANGGNAATLDGIDSSQFVRSDTSDTITATLTARTIVPQSGNTYDLGSSSARWNNVFVNDMHFANSPENPNKVDGTWGDWTLQEGEDQIYMLNNRNGKKYAMNLTEIV